METFPVDSKNAPEKFQYLILRQSNGVTVTLESVYRELESVCSTKSHTSATMSCCTGFGLSIEPPLTSTNTEYVASTTSQASSVGQQSESDAPKSKSIRNASLIAGCLVLVIAGIAIFAAVVRRQVVSRLAFN